MELLADGYIFRYFHIWFGIIWIGTLYYFNFMQTPFMAEADAATKPGVTTKLLPRALWWFRWGAMLTFLTGLILFHVRWIRTVDDFSTIMGGAGGMGIVFGGLLGITMWANVWHIIWPKQKIIIASANAVAGGGQADPRVAASAARAGVASRTNTLFSIPMLFFMTFAAHNPLQVNTESSLYVPVLILMFGSWAVIEFNAIKGKMVKPLATVQNVITSGFVLTVVYYIAIRSVAVL